MPNGHVIKHFGNGDAFHGYYVDGLRHGDGIMHYADAQGRDVGFTLKVSLETQRSRANVCGACSCLQRMSTAQVHRSCEHVCG